LEETQHQLVQSAKLAAVGELAAGVAHEINNPLTTIIALTSLLAESSSFSEAQHGEDLRMIHIESRRARDIVRNLLNFARATTPKPQLVDFNQLVEEAISLVYIQQVSQKIILQKSLPDLPQLSLDINQMKQVIVNLLNNAIQAMLDNEEQGILTIKTAVETLKEGGTNGAESVVICTISDSGPGIAPEHIDKIFDPFFTTKEVGQGTGLGLSISYGIIKKHGGEIRVDSKLGQGATFILTLPISDQL
jgi:two-component system NtrC family sensor kinase